MTHRHPDHHQRNTRFLKMRAVIIKAIQYSITAAVGKAESDLSQKG